MKNTKTYHSDNVDQTNTQSLLNTMKTTTRKELPHLLNRKDKQGNNQGQIQDGNKIDSNKSAYRPPDKEIKYSQKTPNSVHRC